MNEVDKAYVKGYASFKPEEPIPDDTLAVWLTGITAAISVIGMVVWIISLL